MVEPYVVFGEKVTVEDGAVIHSFSHLAGAHVGKGVSVGPFARLRPGTRLGDGARIGNFVEVKEAVIEAGAKANHLSYIGDAFVGAGANVGAGTITCNYDGSDKHRTTIGDGAFIGSNSALVAPVEIGARRLYRLRLGDHQGRAGRRAGFGARASRSLRKVGRRACASSNRSARRRRIRAIRADIRQLLAADCCYGAKRFFIWYPARIASNGLTI